MKTPQVPALPGMTPLGISPKPVRKIEYTVHFQKGVRVGARSLHMVRVQADSVDAAIKLAKTEHATWGDIAGYKLTRVDHFNEEDGHLEIDR
jgi:hypothetical protein